MKRSPAQVYAAVFGAVLTLAGITGFFYTADFSTGSGASDPANVESMLGFIDVNGWSNALYVVTGVLGLGGAGDWFRGKAYAWGNGLFYLAMAAWGFAIGSGEAILGLFAVNTAASVCQLVVGIFGVTAALVTSSAPAPTLAPGPVGREHTPQLDHMP